MTGHGAALLAVGGGGSVDAIEAAGHHRVRSRPAWVYVDGRASKEGFAGDAPVPLEVVLFCVFRTSSRLGF